MGIAYDPRPRSRSAAPTGAPIQLFRCFCALWNPMRNTIGILSEWRKADTAVLLLFIRPTVSRGTINSAENGVSGSIDASGVPVPAMGAPDSKWANLSISSRHCSGRKLGRFRTRELLICGYWRLVRGGVDEVERISFTLNTFQMGRLPHFEIMS